MVHQELVMAPSSSDTNRPGSLVSLMYHDVVVDRDWDSSGFNGAGADRYKLTLEDFRQHLAELSSLEGRTAALAPDVICGTVSSSGSYCLTFDDGGASASSVIVDALEEYGFKGHFFITANRIGESGFVTEDELRQIHERGHLIGAHSWSHPPRFAILSPQAQQDEWSRCIDRLSTILNSPVTVASVPGGFYDSSVAASAGRAGIRILFNSEPVATVQNIHGVAVCGRYTMIQDSSASECKQLAANNRLPALRQAALWNARKLGKKFLGPVYLKARRAFLERQ